MHWFWLGFFAFVAGLLVLDLGVLHKKKEDTPSIRSAAYWTAGWMTLGLAFTGFVYLMYENGWLGATLHERGGDGIVRVSTSPGPNAAFEYVSAYLLEYALSVDNIFVIALVFKSFKVPAKHQHRVLFWGIIGAFVFRLAMLTGGAAAASRFSWVFYIFGAYLAYQGIQLLRGKDDEEDDPAKSRLVRFLRRFVRVVDDPEGRLMLRVDGYRALTTTAVCLITIELTDVVFALDSIPAVLSVSEEVFIMVTSNILAIMGLRSLYFVLVGAMAKFHYLEMALGVLLILIGVKLAANNHYHVPNAISLALIAGIIGAGVFASVLSNRRAAAKAEPAED